MPIVDIIPAMLTGIQIRAARAALKWTAQELADKAGIHFATVIRCEGEDGIPGGHIKTLMAIKTALEQAGIEFSETVERVGVLAPRNPRR